MSHAYGPVPSRRFGRSIGVSPIPPKTCSYSCVYCQLGKTTDMRAERGRFFDPKEIEKDIENTVTSCGCKADFITIVGDGEPTLSANIGELISFCKSHLKIPVAIITNGSLLWNAELQLQLRVADVVSVTVSAGDEETFRKIHRPHGSLKFSEVMSGMETFRKSYQGKFWAEVMLVAGLNDSNESIVSIKKQLQRLSPDKVFIATPTRPPTEPWVKPPDPESVLNAASILGGSLEMTFPEMGSFNPGEHEDVADTILQLCSRHPMMEKQVRELEARLGTEVADRMADENVVQWKEYMGIRYLLPVRK
ncbi:MAG: radical SAM protein [Thermoplasmata archaeon]|nr:radical SAM protein [Thermoplasmata archaeon]